MGMHCREGKVAHFGEPLEIIRLRVDPLGRCVRENIESTACRNCTLSAASCLSQTLQFFQALGDVGVGVSLGSWLCFHGRPIK